METLDLFLNGGQSLLDNIEFSPLSVPEPSEWALIGIGTILLGIRRFSEMTQIEKRQKTNLRFRVGSA